MTLTDAERTRFLSKMEAGSLDACWRWRRVADGERLSDLAREYRVTIPSVSRVVHNKQWRHIAA